MDPQIRDMPEGFGGLDIKDMTTMAPLGIALVLLMGLAMVLLPRRWAIIPMLIVACFIPSSQKIAVLTLDFNVIRIMVLFGVFRLYCKKEYAGFTWKTIDKVLLAWVMSSTLIYTLQQGTFSAFVNRLGFAFDASGMYFLFRCLIQNWEDISRITLGCVLISIPVALFFLLENRTGHNMFSVFGGVPEITVIREGRLRCRGAYAHPIIAGCFWMCLVPFFVAYWRKSAKDWIWAMIGVAASLVIVVCCSSSTPVMGAVSAMFGGLFFFLRNQMHFVRWGVFLILIALHTVMNKPVWHLISRVSAVGGSTSYFRYMLIDSAIKHFREWVLIGTNSTAHWFWGAQDLCNHYVLEGVEGGFLTLCLFIAVIVIAFRDVGRIWRSQIRNPYYLAISWAFGVSLFVHCMNFIGLSYFGQMWIPWYLLLAMIGSMTVSCGQFKISLNSPKTTKHLLSKTA